MTREELKREAKEYADKYGKFNFDLWDTARFAYYQGAEPREKRIEELEESLEKLQKSTFNMIDEKNYRITDLEKENAELEAEVKEWKDKADLWCKTANLKDHNIMINKELEKENADLQKSYEELYNSMRVIKDQRNVLEKENAELKEKLEVVIALKDEEIGCIQTDFNTFKSKAKELLERLLITSCNSDVLNLLPNCSEVLRIRVEAEQFLNSEVENDSRTVS